MFAFVPVLALLAVSVVDATAVDSCSAQTDSFHLDDDLFVLRVQEFGGIDFINSSSIMPPCLPPYPPIPYGIDFDFEPYCGSAIESIDGYCNNIYDPTAGQVGTHVKRLTSADFDDGEISERVAGLPEARFLSNNLFAQNYFDDSSLNGKCLNDLHTHMGQFFNHDKHTSGAGTISLKPIPANDQHLDPASSIFFRRSLFEDVPFEGNLPINPAATGHLDLSVVYGTSASILTPLLDFSTGKFLVEEKTGGLFPPEFNHIIFGPLLQLGDGVRGNTHPALMSLQVLFVREHNYWIERLGSLCISCEVEHSAKFNTLGINYYGHSNIRNGKHCVYVPFSKRWNIARRITISMIQRMVVFEWFPALLGEKTIPYSGYQTTCDPRPSVEAMAAALRFGHSSLRDFVQRRNYKDELVNDSIGGFNRLEDSLFDPTFLTQEPEGLDHVFRGALHVQQSRASLNIPNVLRGIQIGATDIARGRDMGIPGYFQVKRELGLHGPTPGLISEVNDDFPEARWKLAEFYSDPEKIDLFAGMLSEDLPVGSTVGETCAYILKDMLDTIRHCDRFYFENPGVFSKVLFNEEVDAATDEFFLNLVHDSPMSEILMRNTDISRFQLEGYVATIENIFIMKKDRCQGDGGEEPFDLAAYLGLDLGLKYKGGKHTFPPSPYPSPTPYYPTPSPTPP